MSTRSTVLTNDERSCGRAGQNAAAAHRRPRSARFGPRFAVFRDSGGAARRRTRRRPVHGVRRDRFPVTRRRLRGALRARRARCRGLGRNALRGRAALGRRPGRARSSGRGSTDCRSTFLRDTHVPRASPGRPGGRTSCSRTADQFTAGGRADRTRRPRGAHRSVPAGPQAGALSRSSSSVAPSICIVGRRRRPNSLGLGPALTVGPLRIGRCVRCRRRTRRPASRPSGCCSPPAPPAAQDGAAQLRRPDRRDPAARRDRRAPPVWATFYDIRRYGGLQIFLRGMLGTARWCCRAPASRSPTTCARLADAASPISPARRRTGGGR